MANQARLDSIDIPLSAIGSLLGDWATGPEPLYAKLHSALRAAIERGAIPAGSRLPPERTFATALRVSRSTMVAAIRLLEEDGLVRRRQGSGTTVIGARAAALDASRSEALSGPSLGRNPAESAHVIQLSIACPDLSDIVPGHVWAEAAGDLGASEGGAGYQPMGVWGLREAIASHMARWGVHATPDEILVTTGGMQAIALITQLLVKPGQPVVVETPTYPVAIDLLRMAGADLTPIGVDGRGATVEGLRKAVAQSGARLVYLVPTCQNPTGAVMTERRRRLVADLAGELDLTVIEDNTIHDLALVEPPPAIASMATGGTIITVGSMSKLFWGGLRIGWARAPEPVTARLGRLKLVHDHGSSIVSQLVARRLLLHEVPRAIAARRAQIRGHLDLVLRFFAERLPDWEITHPAGGVALWLRLPRGDAAELAQVALSHGVAVVPGGLFSPEEAYADRLRISLVRDINTFHEGLHRLAAAWEEYSADHRASRPELSLVV